MGAAQDAAQVLIKARKMPEQAAWLRSRLGMENDRPRVVPQAAAAPNDKWGQTVKAIYQDPAKYHKNKQNDLPPPNRRFLRHGQQVP